MIGYNFQQECNDHQLVQSGYASGSFSMPKSRSRLLQEQSLSMAVAAIEIYNKPNFPSRDLIFPILMVNAWESLAKAKLLKEHRNRLETLYIKIPKTGRYKRSASGEYLTINARDALKQAGAPEVVRINVGHLIDLRDDATHLPMQSSAHAMLIFNLGAASLQSYAALLREWFDVGLGRYNFFILPLGFSYPFTTMNTIELTKEPETIARIVREVAANQDRNLDEGDHHLVCEIEVELVSAKKLTGDADFVAGISQNAEDAFVNNRSNHRDQYPYSWTEAFARTRELCPGITSTQFNSFIREQGIKGNPSYSTYSYTTLSHEQRGPTKGTTVIYNMDFVKLCAAAHRM